jgi:polar amino acid transport system substrate-binding protein
MRIIQTLLGLFILLLGGMASANGPAITISTNNTPQDRKVLELVSQEAFRRAGLVFQLDRNPSARSLDLANEGSIDGEGLRVAGLEQQYPNLVQVPERYTSISFVAFARDASIKLDHGWESLKPHRIAFINGWKMYEANATTAQSITKVDKPDQLFRMLEANRIDLALYTLADGSAIVKNLAIPGIAPLTPALRNADMFLYLNKKHQAHVPRIAQALKDMKADGTYAKILAQISSAP